RVGWCCAAHSAMFTRTSESGGSDEDRSTVNSLAVTISKEADAGQVNAGAPSGFTVTLTNSGAGAAYGVQNNDPLPGGNGVSWSIDSNTPAQSCSRTEERRVGKVHCGPATRAAGGTKKVHVASAAGAKSCDDRGI